MSNPNQTQMLSADPNRTLLGAGPTLDPNKTVMGTAPTMHATITIKPVQCPICKAFNPPGVMFCIDCGLIFDRALPDDAFGAPAIQVPMLLESSGREHALRPGITSVGREADIALADGRISRRHAQFHYEGGALTLEDLGSTNGTKVNGTALSAGQKVGLIGGEKVSFGGFEMMLSMPGAAVAGGNVTQAFASNKTSAMAAPPQKETPAAVLVGNGSTYPLRQGVNSFGRRDTNDVQILDPYVSGKHGEIEIGDAGVFLTDVGSSNGTAINEAKLSPNIRTEVGKDDVIRLGSMEFRVQLKQKAGA